MNLIYAKKFRFPDNSANMIQGVNMVAAFYHCNTNTNAFFSFNDTIDDRNLFLKNYYGINFSAYSDRILFTSQKLRGLKYNLWLMKNIITKKERLFSTKCINLISILQGIQILITIREKKQQNYFLSLPD